MPVIAFHGTADPIDPYSGAGQAYWTYSVPVAAQRWASHEGCDASATPMPVAGDAQLTAFGGCADGGAVELYTIADAGHTWPGGPKLSAALLKVLGPQSSLDANSLIWSFFKAHPLR